MLGTQTTDRAEIVNASVSMVQSIENTRLASRNPGKLAEK